MPKKIELLSPDLPREDFYGHPKGVYGWDNADGGKRNPGRSGVRPLHSGSLTMDHKADHKRERYVRLHGIPVAVIKGRKDWWLLEHAGTKRGSEKSMKECMAAIRAAL